MNAPCYCQGGGGGRLLDVVAEWGGGGGIFQFVSDCVKTDVDGNMKAQTQKAPCSKVRSIVKQM